MLCDVYYFINEFVQQQFTVPGARVLPMAGVECPLCLEPLEALPTLTFPCCQLVSHRACLGVEILQGPCPQCRAMPYQRHAVAESRKRIRHLLREEGEMKRRRIAELDDSALTGIRTPPIWCMIACCAEPEWSQVAPADERLMVQCQCAYNFCSPHLLCSPLTSAC